MTTDDGKVRIDVTDKAGGVPEDVKGRIFKSFFSTKPAGKGTGLGLSICARIVRDMRGDIAVTNRDGGAVFTVTLPLAS